MSLPLDQHQKEIQQNLEAWKRKPLLQALYRQFYRHLIPWLSQADGRTIEIGAGIGNLKEHLPEAITTDLFPNPWIDKVGSAYDRPFEDQSASNLILIDVFHHLERPFAFFSEARRVLAPGGRVILLEPYISLLSSIVYGPLHHEPIGRKADISENDHPPEDHAYYAAQGNATRLFFKESRTIEGFQIVQKEAFACWAYFLSGGFSKPAIYPKAMLPVMNGVDGILSMLPSFFAGRCVVVLKKA